MLFNKKINHNICFEVILLRILESKNILYNKLDIFREKMCSQLITYRSNCTNQNNIKLLNKII